MIKQHDCNRLLETFDAHYKTPKRKFLVIWVILTIVLLFIVIQVFHANGLFTPQAITEYDVFVWIITFGFFGIGILIYMLWHPKRATYEIVFQDIFNFIKVNEARELTYLVKPKVYKKLNKDVLLFPGAPTYNADYSVKSYTEDKTPFTLFYGTGIIQAGQYSSQAFKGLYTIIPIKNPYIFQIRSKGKPPRKTNLVKVYEVENLALFIEKDKQLTYSMKQQLAYFQKLFSTFDYKHLYIAGLNDSLHVAYESSHLPKTLSHLSCDIVNELYKTFKQHLDDVSHFKGYDYDQ